MTVSRLIAAQHLSSMPTPRMWMVLRYIGLTAAAAILIAAARYVPWLMRWPEAAAVPFADWLNALLKAIAEQQSLPGVTVKDVTRAIGDGIAAPTEFLKSMLSSGFTRGYGVQQVLVFPPVSWLSLTLIATVASYRRGGWPLALLAAGTCAYLLSVNLWVSTMATLAQLAVAVPLSLLIGVLLGLFVYRVPRAQSAVFAFLNQMQTIPLFAYLVPTIMFFGIGTTAGIIAVVVFASPPMVRATAFGLEEARSKFGELSDALGTTPAQALWKILVPAAQTTLRLGLNQVIMLAFATVILAALVGAQGIGYDVLIALQRLAIGRGLEAGLAITLTAILLDRFLQQSGPARFSGKWMLLIAVVAVLMPWLLSSQFAWLETYPKAWTFSSAKYTDVLVDQIVQMLYEPVTVVRDFAYFNVLSPLKAALLGLPWFAVAAGVLLVSWSTGAGPLRALVLFGLVCAVAATGYWDRAMLTLHLCLSGSLLALAVGFPLGVLAAKRENVGRILLPLADTFQTLPAFIYLIPVIMLFGSGDVPCVVAIAVFATCPAIRYTASAFAKVPHSLIEVGQQIGASPLQRFVKIEFPAALPNILLAIAQVALMSLAMVVVTALIGTTDLGQLIMLAISKANSGQALVAGICVAIIGIVADGLLTDKANQINKQRRTT